MARETNEERIVAFLLRRPGIDDDEISQLTGITPRQQVNQICRRLERQGVLRRSRGSRGKIVNALVGAPRAKVSRASVAPASELPPPSGTPAPKASRTIPTRGGRRLGASKIRKPGASRTPAAAGAGPSGSWRLAPPDDLSDTLLIVPCSKSKANFPGRRATGTRIGNHLPDSLAKRLDRARAANHGKAGMHEDTLAPAWQRYSGRFYQAAGEALADTVRRRLHLLILSGGYGVVLACEPIGLYEARLRAGWWPDRILEDVLAGYARHHRLKRMYAFVSASGDYRKVVERADWKASGMKEAVLLMPERGGSQSSVSRTQGEAFSALLGGATLDHRWRSTAGLALICRKLVRTGTVG